MSQFSVYAETVKIGNKGLSMVYLNVPSDSASASRWPHKRPASTATVNLRLRVCWGCLEAEAGFLSMMRNLRPIMILERTLVKIEVTASHWERLVLKLASLINQNSRNFVDFEQILKRIWGHDLNFNQTSYIIYTRPNVSFHNKKSGLGLNAASEEPQNQAKGKEDKWPLVRPSWGRGQILCSIWIDLR